MSFAPNTTPTPNWLYNGEMRKMTESELKVVLLVTRKTFGWFDPSTKERKQQDYISQKQFMEFTGQSHTAIACAIQSCVEHGWIIARDRQGNLCNTSNKRRRRKVWYQLGSIFTKKIPKKSKQQSGLDENLSNNLAKSKQQSCVHLSNNLDNTKETNTKETNTKEMSDKSDNTFNLFWLEYPRKVKKKVALTVWKKSKLDEHADKIIEFVVKAKKTEEWTKKRGTFIPHPSSFLRQERWNDDLESYGIKNIKNKKQNDFKQRW